MPYLGVLDWLPTFGTPTPRGIILPAIVLSLSNIAILTRLTRAAMLDVLGKEFVPGRAVEGAVARRRDAHAHLPQRRRTDPHHAWA